MLNRFSSDRPVHLRKGEWIAPSNVPFSFEIKASLLDPNYPYYVEIEMCTQRCRQLIKITDIYYLRKTKVIIIKSPPLPVNSVAKYWLIENHEQLLVRRVFTTDSPKCLGSENINLQFPRLKESRNSKKSVKSEKLKQWEGRTFYYILIDRFARIEGATPHFSWSDTNPCDVLAPHGGNFKGIESKVGYLAKLGVGAVILSPVYVNDRNGYHGYHPLNFLMTDPRLGTLEELNSLIDKFHKYNINVILDVIVNHSAPWIKWSEEGGKDLIYESSSPPNIYPTELCSVGNFHAPGGRDLCTERLFGFLEDFKTENQDVMRNLIHHLFYWLQATNIDGFRYDAVRHVNLDFWACCITNVREFASDLGRPHFLQIAEHAGHEYGLLKSYLDAGGFDLMLDYPQYFQMCGNPHVINDVSAILKEAALNFASAETKRSEFGADLLLSFIENHDTSRFLGVLRRKLGNPKDIQAFGFGMFCLLLGKSPPMIYYGSEQLFDGQCMTFIDRNGSIRQTDSYVREDMFINESCAGELGSLNNNNLSPYSISHDAFHIVRLFAKMRLERPDIWQTGNRHTKATEEGVIMVNIYSSINTEALTVILNPSLDHSGPYHLNKFEYIHNPSNGFIENVVNPGLYDLSSLKKGFCPPMSSIIAIDPSFVDLCSSCQGAFS
jgi:glycosidase